MELDELIDDVEQRAASAEPLSRLVAAVQLQTELTTLSDDLLDHFIQEARAAGCSWTQIGDTLGVTKQAAQKRHGSSGLRGLFRNLRPGRMFQRFTPRARNAVVEAQQAARELGHGTIGTEHVLLGFFGDDQSIASRVLAGHEITRDDVVAAIREWHDDEGEPADEVKGHIPFSRGAKKTLEMALKEALDLGHNYIGTEHQLLGILRVDDDLGAQILQARGLTLEATRAEVVEMLGQTPKA